MKDYDGANGLALREFDADSYAKEDCHCGHRRHQHQAGTGACSHTVQRTMPPEGLPSPVYDDPADPFATPTNWPPVSEWPVVTVPCCGAFDDEPDHDGGA